MKGYSNQIVPRTISDETYTLCMGFAHSTNLIWIFFLSDGGLQILPKHKIRHVLDSSSHSLRSSLTFYAGYSLIAAGQ